MSRATSEVLLILLSTSATCADAKMFCENIALPVEVGTWRHDLFHMDSATVENKPISLKEGQLYVYENYFPNSTIKYIHVDNLARSSCGASATIQEGGVGSSSVLIILHSEPNHEIRSVIDIWGTKIAKKQLKAKKEDLFPMKYLYLFKDLRTVNHNYRN